MQKNADQKNSEYEHFSRSDGVVFAVVAVGVLWKKFSQTFPKMDSKTPVIDSTYFKWNTYFSKTPILS